MTEFRVEIENADAVIDLLNAAPDVFDKHIRKALQKSGLLVEREAKERVPQATRALFRSIVSDVTGSGASMQAVVSVGEPYGVYMEYGRPPGRMPPHGPGSSLALWAKMVGITSSGSNPTRQDLGILFMIARAIGRRGVEPQPFMEPALDASKGKIQRYFEDAIADAIAEIEGI